jgi:hypothetical protein
MPFTLRPCTVVSISLTVVLSLVFSGCGLSQQEVHQKELNSAMDSWKGHDRDDLLRSWGPPTQETPLSNGGHILSYRRGGGQVFVPLGNMAVAIPRQCQQDFETNSAGTIVSWRYEGHC